jgi:perosamine synthetase
MTRVATSTASGIAAGDGEDGFTAAVIDRLRSVVGPSAADVPLHEPEFAGAEWALVKDCLDTGWVSSVGKYVDRFEAELAAATGVDHAVAVVNGTAALHLALMALDVRPGDEVLVPTLTFVATANAVRHAGALPHFVDSSATSLGLDPGGLATHLNRIADRSANAIVNRLTGRRIAAIVPVHVFGHPVDMDGLLAVAAAFDLPIIEDAAEALGSLYKGRACGGLGRVGTLSFNGNKIVTTGGGGAVVTDDPDLARRIRHLSTTAKLPHRWAFFHDRVGYNYRLPNINAALGCAQLARLPDFVARKRQLAQDYIDAFAGLEGATVFREPAAARSNYWLNTLQLDAPDASCRDRLLDATHRAGLLCRPVWSLLHRLPIFADCPRADLGIAEFLEARLVNIPSSPKLRAEGPA